MRAALLILPFLFFLAGCLSNQAFTDKDVENPCSIVTVDDISAICGSSNMEGVPFFVDYRSQNTIIGSSGYLISKCDFQKIGSGTSVAGESCTASNCTKLVVAKSPLVEVVYSPVADLSYEEFKLSLANDVSAIMPVNITIEKENLGFGDSSIIARASSQDGKGNEIETMVLAVYKGESSILVNSRQNIENKCFSEEKVRKIAELAISKLTK